MGLPGLEKPSFFQNKISFFLYIFFRFLVFNFLGFNLQMSDIKLHLTSTMKSKDKSSEQRFGHVNATNRN